MSLVGLLVTLLVLVLVGGLIWYLISIMPIDPKLRTIAQIIILIIFIIVLLGFLFGGWPTPRFDMR